MVTSFYPNYGYYPHFKTDLGNVDTRLPELSEYISALNNLYIELWADITHAQMAYAEQANRAHHPSPVLKPGDWVWLGQKHIRTTQPSGKLNHKLIGHILYWRMLDLEPISWASLPVSNSI
jgi:hypothetical protein